ncbi:hypothetical protein VVMO6_02777 [Vibrio vulnificus MO6-24/O]|nr:hypothetical protein VVMO6_02777 [Vibrio vulnificus MO6-24/O]
MVLSLSRSFPGWWIYDLFVGKTVLWSCGPVVLWSCGPVVLWSCGQG